MIGLIGINHNTATVSVRESFAFTPEEAVCFVRHLVDLGVIRGGVLLSTCNRMELYFHAPVSHHIRAIIHEIEGVKERKLEANHIYTKEGAAAVEHLFSLGAGLKSMVVGETQILGQIKEALRLTNDAGLTTPLLVRLFDRTFEAAKEVRTSCFVSSIPISAGTAAVSLVMSHAPESENLMVLILGAGQMAEMVLEALKESGHRHVSLYNRTRSRAERFAERHQTVKVYAEEELSEALALADIVFVATSSSKPIITRDLLEEVRTVGKTVPSIFFDMAVPRNVDEAILAFDGLKLYTIDDLKMANSGEVLEEQEAELDRANEIISQAVTVFSAWRDQEHLRSVIGLMQKHSHQLLERDISLLPKQYTPEEIELIRPALEHLRTTMTTDFVSRLRTLTEETGNHIYAATIASLYRDE